MRMTVRTFSFPHLVRSHGEDLVKTVCTTNCDWRNTKSMCPAICGLDGGSFPAPEAVRPYERYGGWRYLAYKFGRMGRRLNYTDK